MFRRHVTEGDDVGGAVRHGVLQAWRTCRQIRHEAVRALPWLLAEIGRQCQDGRHPVAGEDAVQQLFRRLQIIVFFMLRLDTAMPMVPVERGRHQFTPRHDAAHVRLVLQSHRQSARLPAALPDSQLLYDVMHALSVSSIRWMADRLRIPFLHGFADDLVAFILQEKIDKIRERPVQRHEELHGGIHILHVISGH